MYVRVNKKHPVRVSNINVLQLQPEAVPSNGYSPTAMVHSRHELKSAFYTEGPRYP